VWCAVLRDWRSIPRCIFRLPEALLLGSYTSFQPSSLVNLGLWEGPTSPARKGGVIDRRTIGCEAEPFDADCGDSSVVKNWRKTT